MVVICLRAQLFGSGSDELIIEPVVQFLLISVLNQGLYHGLIKTLEHVLIKVADAFFGKLFFKRDMNGSINRK